MATKAKNLALAAASVDDAGNITADLIDSIDSLQFLRSDVDDTMTGLLTLQKSVNTFEDVLRVTNYQGNGDVMAAISYDQSVDTLIIRNDQGFSTGGIALNVNGDPGNTGFFLRTDGNVGIGTDDPKSKLNVVGTIGQSTASGKHPSAIRKVYEGTFDSSTNIDLFTLGSSELPFAGTIYISAYKSSEGVSGVWTAACIYPTVTPVVNQQSYVTRSDEFINLTWSVSNYVPILRVSMGNFSGTTYYTILVDGIVQQNYSTFEGAL